MSNTAQVMLNGIWKKPGQEAFRPALTTNRSTPVGATYGDYSGSSANFVDNSYIRLKTLALTWSMPMTWSNKMKLNHECSTYKRRICSLLPLFISIRNDWEVFGFKTIVFGLRLYNSKRNSYAHKQ
jgi:hypothetical protein